MNEPSVTLRFTKTHEWIAVKDNIATIGITDHAAESLGDIVYVELPEVGVEIRAGNELGIIESVKAASDFYAPLSGKIVATNELVAQDPALINQAAQDAGWLVKIEMNAPDELNNLLTMADYKNQTSES